MAPIPVLYLEYFVPFIGQWTCIIISAKEIMYLSHVGLEMLCWSGGRGILTELSLCCSTVYHYNGAQWYDSSYRSVDWVRL